MNGFWLMGGYAAYVWSSYALTAAVVLWNIIAARQSLREARQLAARRVAMARAGAANSSTEETA